MVKPKSKKGIYVRLKAPMSCNIWFVCKGNLVFTRKDILNGANAEVSSPTLLMSSNILPVRSSSLNARSDSEWRNGQPSPTILVPDLRRVRSAFSSPDVTGGVTPRSRLSTEGSSDVWDGISRQSTSMDSCASASSSCGLVENLVLTAFAISDRNQNDLGFSPLPNSVEHLRSSSSPNVLEISPSDKLYDQLERTVVEAENSRREAFEESIRCRKAAIDAIRRAKASESSYIEELRRRKVIEEDLANGKELEKLNAQLEEVMEELQLALQHKSFLETQIRDSDQIVRELEQKIFSAVELLQNYKRERDELLVERDKALSLAEEKTS